MVVFYVLVIIVKLVSEPVDTRVREEEYVPLSKSQGGGLKPIDEMRNKLGMHGQA